MAKLEKIKKGSVVTLLGFTGMNIGDFPVVNATKTELTIETKSGLLTFSRKTGKQLGLPEEKEKYANKIVLPEDAPEKVERKKKVKKEDKKVEDEPVEPEDAPEKVERKKKVKKEDKKVEDEPVEPEDAPEKVERKKKVKKEDKKVEDKKKPVEPVDDDDDDTEEEEFNLESLTIPELFDFADENDIDLSNLNKKQKKDKSLVIDAIREAMDDDDYEEAE